ncbi:DUF3265 domain-containing protein [Vibrio parahaemolyticus]|nr:DUF3265 domain-containing protein [Vibrio parahaemolyticus]EGQ7886135.1 DUF3265 domain-containing protein [Vibrio parahaemolyticus]EGQ9372318.1 DUF3265 domain-containing protein [Vibrio parahaemolyticus]EGQ9422660.1 DUF3265 domain-containing protein [Vibrio parahaemolyticus]EGQ9423586.1 DUF3265 domain-containing protein [Vibrio parahaemolyticus]
MRNAWHFYHALILVIKVVCGNIVLRCSPLKRALGFKEEVVSVDTTMGIQKFGFH